MKLHRRRKKLQSFSKQVWLFDNHPLPIWVHDFKSLAFLAVNRAAISKYGYTRQEFSRMTLLDIQAPGEMLTVEKDSAKKDLFLQQVGEWRHCAKNGDIFPVQLYSGLVNYAGRQALLVIASDTSREQKARDEVFSLWQQHLQLQEIIRNGPAIAVQWGADPGRPVNFISENIGQFGYRPAQFTRDGLLYTEIIHPEDLRYVQDVIRRHTKKGGSQVLCEYRILTADMQVRWVEERTWIRRDRSQAPGYSGIVLDITERKRVEESLHYQAALLDNVSDAIISTDMAFNIVSWNQAARDIFQWSVDEVIGQRWNSLAETDYLGQEESGVLRQFNAVGYWGGVVSQKRRDGQFIIVDTRISMVKDTKGQPVGVVIACRDISEKVKIEQALSNSEKQYRGIFEQAAVGVSRTNISGNFLEINQKFCQITGYSRQELLKMSFRDITDPVDIETNDRLRQDLIDRKTSSVQMEKRYVRKDGTRTWVNLTLSYIESGPGLEPFLLAITEDINVRKNHERELQALYEAGLALSYLKTQQAIAEKIIQILNIHLDWRYAVVWLREKGTENISILAYSVPGQPEDFDEKRRKSQQMVQDMDTGLTGWSMRRQRTIRCGDVSADPHYVNVNEEVRSGLYVPMMSAGQAIGCIAVENDELDGFSEHDQRLLETLANQATIAFENANLLIAEQGRANQMQAVVQASQAISGTLDLPNLLQTILETAQKAIPATEKGTIFLKLEEDGLLHVSGSIGYLDPAFLNASFSDQAGYAAGVFREKKGLMISDVMEHPDKKYFSRFPEAAQIRSAISAPLMVKGEPIGVISLDNCTSPSAFTENDLQLLSTFAASAAISIENARLFEQTQVRLRHISALRSIDNAINASSDISTILNIIIEQARNQLGVDAACVLSFNPTTLNLEHQASAGFYAQHIRQSRFRMGEGLSARAVLERKTFLITDLDKHEKISSRESLLLQDGFVTYACAPMLAKGEIKGLLEVFHRSPLKPDAEWLSFLEMLGGQTAIAIENTQLYQNLQRSNMELTIAYDVTIEGWAQALELRDQETEGHSRRVTELTLKLARELGLRGEALAHIRRGALLHDIGKMGVPDSILHKPGPLSPEEWDIMRKHPVRAYELLSQIPYLQHGLEIPYCHHERWDGSGYPRGLRGEQIPISARIFAVIDVFDALASDRPYRAALERPEVLDYIRKNSGTHFDPRVVEVFLKIIEDEHFD
jgi:PAS domain S-box-containing protein/putative nucleotidyltransferase with HDIG domain